MVNQKRTHGKERSMGLVREQAKQRYDEISALQGKEKLKHEIEIIKKQIYNTELDMKSFGNPAIAQKLQYLKENLARLEEELKNIDNVKE